VREGGEVVERVRTEAQAIACMLGGEDRRTLFVLTSEGIDRPVCEAQDNSVEGRAGRRAGRPEWPKPPVLG
jgi:hypothetical protein